MCYVAMHELVEYCFEHTLCIGTRTECCTSQREREKSLTGAYICMCRCVELATSLQPHFIVECLSEKVKLYRTATKVWDLSVSCLEYPIN